MSETDPQETDGEAPLDPAMERVRRKLVRLLFVSSAIMMLGFAAVIIGVVYRVNQDSQPRPADPVALEVDPGALQAATVSDGVLVLTIGGDNPRIEVRNLSDGTLLNVFRLEAPQ